MHLGAGWSGKAGSRLELVGRPNSLLSLYKAFFVFCLFFQILTCQSALSEFFFSHFFFAAFMKVYFINI